MRSGEGDIVRPAMVTNEDILGTIARLLQDRPGGQSSSGHREEDIADQGRMFGKSLGISTLSCRGIAGPN